VGLIDTLDFKQCQRKINLNMEWNKFQIMNILSLIIMICLSCDSPSKESKISNTKELILDDRILVHEVDLRQSQVAFYYKDEQNINFKNHKRLKEWLGKQNKQLIFAVNGGMYNKDLSPKGLYIENGKEIQAIDLKEKGYGNFYLQPNGVFLIDKNNKAKIIKSYQLENKSQIKYATQSGPMLLIDGAMHPKFRKGSKNIHIRNGVGILPNGNLLFAMSKEKINFYDFADYFRQNDCKNALYLDGFVSRTYLPSENWIQQDGNFGVIIAEVY